MTRKHFLLLAVLIVLGLIGSALAWNWYRDRRESAAVDALIAELVKEGEAVELSAATVHDIPERPARADLDRQLTFLLERMRETRQCAAELQRRAEEVIPLAPEPKREQLRDALSIYVFRLAKAQERYLQSVDQIRAKRASVPAADVPE